MSFNETYIRYYPELVRYGRQLNINRDDLEDIIQETFIKYHVELERKIVFENTRAWLYKVMLNLLRTRNNTKSLHESRIEHYRLTEVDRKTINDYDKNERRELVFQVLRKIPEKDRNILILYHQGLKYREIAEVLEMNPKFVGTYLVRAINKLKDILMKDYHELFG